MLQKIHYFFFRELQHITILLLIRNFYTTWSTRFISPRVCVEFSIFDSISFLLKFTLLFDKTYGLFDFEISQFLSKKKVKEKPHTVLQQEIWKFSDVCLTWGSPKNNLKMIVLNSESQSFEYVTFSQ